jgi:hypothetical protein
VNALDTALCDAVKSEAHKAGIEGKVWGQVIFKNPTAVALDVHTVRIQACVGKKWRSMAHYPIDIHFTPSAAIERFAKDFVEFYNDAMAA